MREVLRRPDAAVPELKLNRRILEHRRGVVAAGLECSQIYCGLYQRADGPARIERAVKTVGSDFASADHRNHIAAVGLGDDHRAL